ncbi:Six-hairpin glycosidase [Aspergillus costaricaensis CBS 115574]|uniref:Six-hairpin glycosidase n=1 Tax=Aspergillus costaricaensis CBS 115574 TaxID=1448317 RepID=A0ACD1IFD5_9EURO|nr:Six-hairpin glycosidase [Aspergillus costaricaensis CBS 115574]RAK89297.1 Six-hairpin glycosidase [Aspergillus costaricaensis CBS 115574]
MEIENVREAIGHLYVQQLAVRVAHRCPKARKHTDPSDLVIADEIDSDTIVLPTRYGTSLGFANYTQHGNASCFTLDQKSSLITLDYGTEVGGFPFFHVDSLSNAVQIEAKYTETKTGLDEPFGDGPWTFSNGLSDTFRVETFNVTSPGTVESFFIQGGLRWQNLKLLTDGSVRICEAGIKSGNDRTPVNKLPGFFESSNNLYNEIWALGPRTVQQACIAADTAPSTWEVTDEGVYLRGQQPAQSVAGASFDNYTMTFQTKIIRGGTGWKVAAGVGGFGPYFVLTSEYPADSTFVNTNRTIVPANTLAVGYGWNLVNQTSLTTGKVNHYSLPFNMKEGEWYEISTSINATGYAVTINGTETFVALDDLQIVSGTTGSSGSLTGGTWGFGPYRDQIALVKDVEVIAQNGTQLYQNPMTLSSVLEEYGVMASKHSVCLDGAKRDRLVWNGDFVHTYRVIQSSTYRSDFITGSLEYWIDRQAPDSSQYAGYFSMSPAMGQSAKYVDTYASFGLLDYQLFLLNVFAGHYRNSGDKVFVAKHWTKIKKGVEAILPLIDDQSGLAVATDIGAFFSGSDNGTAVSGLLAHTLDQMADVASAINETDVARTWTRSATSIKAAISQRLWNSSFGYYATDLSNPTEQSITGTAWAILAGVANATQAESSLAALSSLRLGIGYKTSSSVADASTTNLAPFLTGFLLESILQESRNSPNSSQARSTAISVLLDQLWAAMVTQDEYYTGTTWEYLYPDGRPGLDLYTSHAHPWAAAPTYVLSEYVLGVQATSAGFSDWEFRPAMLDVNVSWARGRVPTPHGAIQASWRLNGTSVQLSVCGPSGTEGVVSVPFSITSYSVNGKQQIDSKDGLEVHVSGGSCTDIHAVRG